MAAVLAKIHPFPTQLHGGEKARGRSQACSAEGGGCHFFLGRKGREPTEAQGRSQPLPSH